MSHEDHAALTPSEQRKIQAELSHSQFMRRLLADEITRLQAELRIARFKLDREEPLTPFGIVAVFVAVLSRFLIP